MAQVGDGVKDDVTGFRGMVIAKCFYLHGDAQVLVQPIECVDGKIVPAEWLSDRRVTVVDALDE